jgi:zinc protease
MKYILFILLCFSLYAEEGLDQEALTGQLPNGLTYYVRHHGKPKEKVSLRLVVKVGSIYEEEEERGIAHFVEHMVFRGSEHLADGEAERYARSLGAWNGVDTNAYTTFESTVYEFDLPIEDQAALKQGLFILSEFAGRATFPQECVEKERNVILDEMNRSLSSAKERKNEKLVLAHFENSIYGKRLPIGTQEVIINCNSEKLHTFYRKWYRPDRMAVVVVGDCNAEEAVGLIRSAFQELPCPKETVQEPSREIAFSKREKAIVHLDPDLTATTFSMNSIYRTRPLTSVDSLTGVFQGVHHILNQILAKRLEKLCSLHPTIFLHTWIGDSKMTDFYSVQGIGGACFEGHLQEAIELFSKEVHRFFAKGVTQAEWEKGKAFVLTYLNFALTKLSEREHEDFIDDYVDHFLSGSLVISDHWMICRLMQDIEKLSLEDIHINFLNPQSVMFFLSVATPSMEIVRAFSSHELLALVAKGKYETFAPPMDIEVADWVFTSPYEAGEIVEEHECGEGITAWTLSNGMHVLVKPTRFKKGELHLSLLALGGLSAFTENELPVVHLAPKYLQLSGIGNLARDDAREFLSRNLLGLSFNLISNYRSISASALSREKHHLAFELMHTILAQPRLDFDRWELVVQKTNEQMRQELNDPHFAFAHFIREKNSQNHPLFRFPNLDNVSEEETRKCCKRLFGNPQEFTALVVGDVDLEEVREWTLRYLASIPPGEERPLLNMPIQFPQEVIRDVFAKGEPLTSTTVISIPSPPIEDRMLQTAVLNLLQERLKHHLRGRMGNTYGVGVRGHNPFYPDCNYRLIQITFTSDMKEIDVMLQAVFEEIEKIKEQPPSLQEVENLQKRFKNADRENREANSYWINRMEDKVFGYPPLNPNFMFTAEDLQRMAAQLLSSKVYTIFSHVPVDKNKLPLYDDQGTNHPGTNHKE